MADLRIRISEKALRIAPIGIAAIIVVTVSVLWILTLRQRTRAEAFLQDVVRLVPGKSSFAEAQRLAQSYGGIPWWVGERNMRCTFQRCNFRFVFENKPLTSYRLAPYVALIGWIEIQDGLVVGRQLDYVRYPRADQIQYSAVETPMWNEEGTVSRQRKEGIAKLYPDGRGMPHVVEVTLGPSTSADERRRAYSLDLSCLARLFGCGNPLAMFPHDIEYRGRPYTLTVSDNW